MGTIYYTIILDAHSLILWNYLYIKGPDIYTYTPTPCV